LIDNGYSFAVARVYMEVGEVDPNGAQTIINARAGGMSYVDGYIYPCLDCGNPAQQVIDTVNYLQQSGANYGMLWFDIEGSWADDVNTNINFIQGLIDQANAMGVHWGIYTSYSQWGPITGNTDRFGAPPLWYAHYDGDPSFGDFSPFGGWSKPSIKQYDGDVDFCGASLDKNFY